MQYLNTFGIVLISVIATAVGGVLILGVKWLFCINKNVNKMVNNGKRRAGENQVQFQMLRAHGKAIRATLEVVGRNATNGNVKKAFLEMDEADKAYDKYSDGLVGFQDIERVKK
jgi:hypothetical protein